MVNYLLPNVNVLLAPAPANAPKQKLDDSGFGRGPLLLGVAPKLKLGLKVG